MGNSRGTSWSRRHQHLSVDQVEFWDFSFHEMAMYDLPAMIDFVLQKTGQKQIYYVGYSQGCTVAFIAFSSMPELAQKIQMFFALAPVVIIKHARRSSAVETGLSMGALVGFLDRLPGKKQFLPQLCKHPLLHKPCANLLFLLGGYNEKNLNMTRLDVYTSHYPDGTSVKNMIHWAQVGSLKRVDHDGSSSERPVSLQETPPSYRVEEMPVPTAVWSGGEDWAADWRDVRLLLPRIAHLVTYGHIPDWNHWDFVWGLDAPGRLYSSILELMEGSQ
uniref:AB hydrolase-1 domain-containing protein n=1 Tax=Buteo japonicus TaxID=224669 RepID=A0A8C0BSU8_9AVES